MNSSTSSRRRSGVAARCALALGLCVGAFVPVLVAGGSVAAAGAPSRLVAVQPCRLLDTRSAAPVEAGQSLDVEVAGRCGVPASASAVVLTITVVDPNANGFATVWPTGQPRPHASAINYRDGDVIANMAMIAVGARRSASLFTLARSHFVVDVSGYFEPVSGDVAAGRFVAVPARRLIDTRSVGRPAPGGVVRVVTGVPSDATAVAVNITTAETLGAGFFTAYPAGVTRPLASVLNSDRPRQTRAAATIVPVSAGAFDVFTSAGDHVIVDITGYFTGASGPRASSGLFVPTTPTRLVDTRLPNGASGGPRLWDLGEREFAIAGITGGGVAAVALNLALVDTEDATHVVAGPARVARDTTSTVNADGAQATVANAAIVQASTLGVAFRAVHATHLVADVTGWFTGAPVAPTTGAPTNQLPPPRRVTVISDSAMAGVRWNGALAGFQGFVADARLESCRRLVQSSCRGREGYAPLTAQNEINALPTPGPEDIVVIAVGYNDWNERFSSDFDAVVATARANGFHHVAWVTYRSGVGYTLPGSNGAQSNYAAMNAVLAAKVASGEFPEVRLWDLDRYSADAVGWFAADGVHETVVGSWGVADWISRHVAAFDGRPCARPWSPGAALDDPCPHPDVLPATRGYPSISALYGV